MSQDTVNLTIRSTIKKVDEITFRCPAIWTVYQLKTFIAMTHRQGQDYFKPAKTHLYFGGALLKDDNTIADVLKNKNLKLHFVFIAKFIASLEPEAPIQPEEEYVERNKVLDDYSTLFAGPYQNYRKNTSIEELDYLNKLPLMADSVSKHLVKRKVLSEEPEDKNQNQDGANENQDDDLGINPEHDYMIKLAVRILVTFMLFRSYFHGTLFYLFLAALGIYFLMKVNQRRAKVRRIERQLNQQNQQLNQQNQQRIAGAPGAPNDQAIPQNQDQNQNQNQSNQDQNQEAPANPEGPVDPQNQENPQPNPPVPTKPTFFAKAKELIVCFVSSFYPSWDLNLYIENHAMNQAENIPQNNAAATAANTENNQNQAENNKEASNQNGVLSQDTLNKESKDEEIKDKINVEAEQEIAKVPETKEVTSSEEQGTDNLF